MKRILLVICVFGVFASCLFGQEITIFKQADSQGKPVPKNGAVLVSLIQDGIPLDLDGPPFYIDVRQYRSVSLLADDPAGTGILIIKFVDSDVSPKASILAGRCEAQISHDSIVCSSDDGVPITGGFEVLGPFLKVERERGEFVTLKAYLKK
jgi:hypothetical protein